MCVHVAPLFLVRYEIVYCNGKDAAERNKMVGAVSSATQVHVRWSTRYWRIPRVQSFARLGQHSQHLQDLQQRRQSRETPG